MFDFAFETNIPSITLWQSLGFNIIGCIPRLAKLSDRQVDRYLILYRALH